MGLRELALFAGAGGGQLASAALGWRTVAACELDPYARGVLHRRQADGQLEPFPVWDDVRTFDGRPCRGHVDIVTGGFPCQAHSTASRGRVVADDLWPEMLRVVRQVVPAFVFAENVNRAPIVRAAADLAGDGYLVRCARVSAAAVGAPHRRPRCWLLATHPDHAGQCPVPVDASLAGIRRSAEMGWAAPPAPGVLGVRHGVAGRMDRMRCIGNGQCPAQAMAAAVLLAREHARGCAARRFADHDQRVIS